MSHGIPTVVYRAALVTVLLTGTAVLSFSASAENTTESTEETAMQQLKAQTPEGGVPVQAPGVQANSLVNIASLPGTMQNFPHTAYYGGPNSSGWPFVGSIEKLGTCAGNPTVACAVNTDCGDASYTCNNPAQVPGPSTPLNGTALDYYAKFSQIISSPTPLSDGRPDIIPALRSRNPNISIFAYVVGHAMWCPGAPGNNSYPEGYFYRDYYLAVNNGDPNCSTTTNRFLWNQDGTRSGYDVNLAYREPDGQGGYTYPVAEAIAEVIYEHAKPGRGFDGIFLDIFCPNYMWAENQDNPWDYARAGYGNDNTDPANKTAFAAGWAAAHIREAQHLRELAVADGHPDFPITGNCGQPSADYFPTLNGWMRENYPYQNGGNFNWNVMTWPWGYLNQEQHFRSPQYNYIFTGAEPSSQPYTQYNQQKMRFGLASASMGNGYHIFEDTGAYVQTSNHLVWWFDEYGVDTTVPQSNAEWGRAKNGQAYTGWLGQPRGGFYHHLLPNNTPEVIPLNTFETDVSHVRLSNFGGAQSTVERSTDAAVGSGSLHVNITQLGTNASHVLFNSDGFTGVAGTDYSVTFYAKASKARAIHLNVGSGAGQTLPITTEWQRYQISVRPTGSGQAVYQFLLGQTDGDIWFDDIKIQTGVSNALRRDFDHGIVLLNPYNVTLNVPLEKPYRKIQGTVNPTLNNGAIVESVTLTPNVYAGIGDAVFLLNFDGVAPSTVSDLRT